MLGSPRSRLPVLTYVLSVAPLAAVGYFPALAVLSSRIWPPVPEPAMF